MRTKKSASHRMMDLLAKRDHSRNELVKKLSAHHSQEEVADAIEYAELNQWLAPEEVIAEKFANELHRKSKGIQHINAKLMKKGLPRVKSSAELEYQKAVALFEAKFGRTRHNKLDEQNEEIGHKKQNKQNGQNELDQQDEQDQLDRQDRQSEQYERNEKDKIKVARFLVARGFDLNIVRKVLYEKLRNS